tara:strand:+ start:12306 stop:13265 length:960 start_codon:yes stop_codon:yes gene_type:complete
MLDKDWKGADLIFDLDGDHLPGVSDRDFPSMLELIQEQAWSLWSDFLSPEFGFDEKYLQVAFSGHRGFHLHLRDPAYLHLDSNARRQLVNYIRGEGVNISAVINNGSGGWRNRVLSGTEGVIDKLQKIAMSKDNGNLLLNELDAVMKQRMRSPECSIKSFSKSKLRTLADSTLDESRITRLKDDPSLTVFGDNTPAFWELVRGDSSVILGSAGETDENVTVDVKRVIRWIGSLHGKCGLRVTEFPLDRLDPDKTQSFDALSEAVALGSSRMFEIEIIEDDVRARILDSEIEGSTGDIYTVTESMATFLTLKGWARLMSV